MKILVIGYLKCIMDCINLEDGGHFVIGLYARCNKQKHRLVIRNYLIIITKYMNLSQRTYFGKSNSYTLKSTTFIKSVLHPYHLFIVLSYFTRSLTNSLHINKQTCKQTRIVFNIHFFLLLSGTRNVSILVSILSKLFAL